MAKPRIDLPEPDEPMETPQGIVVPAPRAGRKLVEIPSNSQAVAIVEGTRRKLADLPVAPQHLNPIACVCIYTMYGLDIQEIAIATKLSVQQINNIRMSNEYAIMQRAIIDTVMEVETGEVKDYIKKATQRAVRKVDNLIDSTNSDVALRAAKDMLDRGGLRPVDVHEFRGRMETGLVIEVVDRRDESSKPVLDMEKED